MIQNATMQKFEHFLVSLLCRNQWSSITFTLTPFSCNTKRSLRLKDILSSLFPSRLQKQPSQQLEVFLWKPLHEQKTTAALAHPIPIKTCRKLLGFFPTDLHSFFNISFMRPRSFTSALLNFLETRQYNINCTRTSSQVLQYSIQTILLWLSAIAKVCTLSSISSFFSQLALLRISLEAKPIVRTDCLLCPEALLSSFSLFSIESPLQKQQQSYRYRTKHNHKIPRKVVF